MKKGTITATEQAEINQYVKNWHINIAQKPEKKKPVIRFHYDAKTTIDVSEMGAAYTRLCAEEFVRTTIKLMHQKSADDMLRKIQDGLLPDVMEDLIGVAQLAILDTMRKANVTKLGFESVRNNRRRAYAAVRAYIRDQQSVKVIQSKGKKQTVYIEQWQGIGEDGEPMVDIVDVNADIARIVHGKRVDADGLAILCQGLTKAQQSVLIDVAKGYSVQQIADRMKRSPATIYAHLNNIKNNDNFMISFGRYLRDNICP